MDFAAQRIQNLGAPVQWIAMDQRKARGRQIYIDELLYNQFKTQTAYVSRDMIYLDFFFSAKGSELQKTRLGMLRSLTNQLFFQLPQIRAPIRTVFMQKYNTFRSLSSCKWYQEELEWLFLDAITEAAKIHPVNIFVDALDEAGEQNAQEIATLFFQMNDRNSELHTSRAKVCMSCRHYPVVSINAGITVSVDDHNQGDIARYIDDNLNIHRLSSHYQVSINRIAMQELKDNLIKNSRGIFQWAALTVPLTKRFIIDGERPQDIQAHLNRLSKELGSLYEYILRNVIKEEYRTHSLLLLLWVCLAEEPLSLSEFRCALASTQIALGQIRRQTYQREGSDELDTALEHRISSWSGGLIEVGDDDFQNKVNVIHQSVSDYMLSHGLKLMASLEFGIFQQLEINAPETGQTLNTQVAHHVLYLGCLEYLQTEGQRALVVFKEYRSEIAGLSLRNLTRFPLMRYAIDHIFYHASQVSHWTEEAMGAQMKLLLELSHIFYQRNLYSDPDAFPKFDPYEFLLLPVSKAGWTTAVRWLLNRSTDRQMVSIPRQLAFYRAIERGHCDTVALLLDATRGLAEDSTGEEPPIVVTARDGQLSMVQLLLHRGLNRNRNEALVAAAVAGHTDIVRLLRDYGAHVNTGNELSPSMLQQASTNMLVGRVKLLLELGADVNARTGKFDTALYAACMYDRGDVIRVLLEAGANAGMRSKTGACALHAAILSNALQLSYHTHDDIKNRIKSLLDAGADINCYDTIQGTPLGTAFRSGNMDAAMALLHFKPDLSILDPEGFTILHAAARYGYLTLVETLINSGADLDAKDRYGGTALRQAELGGYPNIHRLLLRAGANPSASLV